MNLLFKRTQSNLTVSQATGISGVGGGPKFKLWAKVELEPEEQKVVDHYQFDKCVLIESVQPELLRNTGVLALAVFILSYPFFWSSFPWMGALFLSFALAAGVAYFYFDRHRETIFVKDLLHGRYFSCKSIIELARKEAWLETVTAFLRQVMVSAKHWDGTETIKVPVLDKEEAKRIVVRGL